MIDDRILRRQRFDTGLKEEKISSPLASGQPLTDGAPALPRDGRPSPDQARSTEGDGSPEAMGEKEIRFDVRIEPPKKKPLTFPKPALRHLVVEEDRGHQRFVVTAYGRTVAFYNSTRTASLVNCEQCQRAKP